jgi:hypothetical protein
MAVEPNGLEASKDVSGILDPAVFLLALFPRGVAFFAAFLRVMCDFSAAPMRD